MLCHGPWRGWQGRGWGMNASASLLLSSSCSRLPLSRVRLSALGCWMLQDYGASSVQSVEVELRVLEVTGEVQQ